MAKAWKDVYDNENFQSLDIEERQAAQKQYFETVVQPKVPLEDIEIAEQQFNTYAESLRTADDKSFERLGKIVTNLKDAVIEGGKKAPSVAIYGLSKTLEKTGISRSTGILIGARMSPIAAYWGLFEARHIDKKQYEELPFHKQMAVSFGGAIHSAYRSTFKKGDWGTLSGDYVKSATGKSIRENLPEGLKWMDVTLEVLMDLSPDVFIFQGIAKSILAKGVPTLSKEFLKAVPKDMADDLGRIVSDENALKEARKVLLNALDTKGKANKGYVQFWDDITDEALKKGGIKRPSFGLELAERLGYKKLPASRFIGGVETELDKFAAKRLTSAKLIEIVNKPEQIATLKKIGFDTEDKLIRGIVQDTIGNKMVAAEGLFKTAIKHRDNPKAFKSLMVTAEKEKKNALEAAEKMLSLDDQRVNTAVKNALGNAYNPKARVTMNASGGSIAGIEKDEEGNITYNIGKGVSGAILAAGGIKLSQKKAKSFTNLLKKNPAWAKVANMVEDVPKAARFTGLWSRTNTALFNKFAKLDKVSPTAKREAEAFTSYLDASKIKFDDLKDGLSIVRNEEVPFTHYMLALRAAERAQRGLANPNKVTYADAIETVKNIEKYLREKGGQKLVGQFRQAANNVHSWTQKNILEDGYNAGIISKESYEGTLAKNKNYIAFDVLEHIPDSLHNLPVLKSKQLFSVSNQNILRSMRGTEKKIGNPFEATIKKFSDMQNLMARNKVASALIDDPQSQRWLKPVAQNAEEFNIMLSKGLDPVLKDSWNPKFFDTINRLKDGNVERYVVPIELADVMKKLTPVTANKVLAGFNSVFKKGATTMYIPFTITNAFRDSLMAYTTAPVFKASRPDQFAISYVKGFWNGFKHEMGGHSDLATLYLQEGGGFGYVGSLRQFKAAKQDLFKKGIIKKGVESPITNPFKLIEKISTTVELAPRLGTFERALKNSYTPHNAALLARKATIDFSISGTFTQLANLYVPFLNANIQAKAVLTEALIKRPRQTIAKITTAVMLPALASYAWNRIYHSDLYDDIPQNIKDNYFVTVIGEDKDKHGRRVPKYLTIPKGDVGQLSWNPMEFMFDKMYKNNPEELMPFLISYLSDLSPVPLEKDGEFNKSRAIGGLIPPVIKGGVETITGHKFYWDGPVIPEYIQRKKGKPYTQYTELTPKSYKWLAKKFGGSPLHWQNMASNLLAGYGREGLDPSAMMRGLTGRLIKTKGGEIRNQVYAVIDDMDRGYYYTRSDALELVKNGKKVPARKLLQQWNRTMKPRLDEFDERFEEYGYKDRGKLNETYRFTAEKMQNILSPYKSDFTPLQKKLIKGAK